MSIFFVISGFLVTQSLINSKKLEYFFLKRVLRIYPGLFFNFIVVLLLIVPVTITIIPSIYFASLFKALPTIIASFILLSEPHIPDVFKGGVLPMINNSLWTLSYEFLCYFLLGLLGFVFNPRIAIPTLICVFVIFNFEKIFYPNGWLQFGYLHCLTFFIGSCFYLFKEYVAFNKWVFLACLSVQLAMHVMEIYFLPAYVITTTYIILYIALKVQFLGDFSKYGDLSYGLYIYAWPIQKTYSILFAQNANMFLPYCIASFITTIFFAFLSWHLVEKRFIQLKHRLIKR